MFHLIGQKMALVKYGLARAPQDESRDETGHVARNIAMAGAAASPFLGMIGQQPIIHDPLMNPNVQRFNTMSELARQARAGDVLISTKPEGSAFKRFISPVTGSEFYHAQPVTGVRGNQGLTMTAGEFNSAQYHKNLKLLKQHTDTVTRDSRVQGYPDITLLRPKKPLTGAEQKVFSQEAMHRARTPYDKNKALTTWLREIFMPKIGDKSKAKAPPICEGNVCSTLPAMAYAKAGRSVIKGKRPEDVFPTDYLRSPNFEAVGARIKSQYKTSPEMRKLIPYLTRAGIGTALAGGTYAVSKDPAVGSLPLGFMAGSTIANRLYDNKLPNLLEFLTQIGEAKGKARSNLLHGYLGKRLPASLAGAAASYAGTRGLQHLFRGSKPAPTDQQNQ
jgi:hypothetical protein